MLHPPIASFCPGVTNILNLTSPWELGFHEPSLFLTSFSYVEPPPFSKCESNGLSVFKYQTKPPGLVGYKNETPSSPTLLPALSISVVLVLVTLAPKTIPSLIKGDNIIAPPVIHINLRKSPRDIFPSGTKSSFIEETAIRLVLSVWHCGCYLVQC